MKICSKCKNKKSITNFHKKSSTKDGFNSWCKECINRNQNKYRQFNKSDINKYKREYRQTHKEQIHKSDHKHYISHKERRTENARKWRKKNKDKFNEHVRNRYKVDIDFKLQRILRIRLHKAIKYNYKSGSAVRDLCCSIKELRLHLESLFQPGMTWDNHTSSGWHIDHIIPLSSFDLTDREQLLKACHYTNLQPLWAFENISKSDKLIM